MAESAVKAIIALVRIGIDCCQICKRYKEEAERIGTRLTVLLAQTPSWSAYLQAKGDDGRILCQQLNESIQNVILCLRTISSETENRSAWSARMKILFNGKNMYNELLRAEKNLDIVLQDLQLNQTNVLVHQMVKNSADLQTLLEIFNKKSSISVRNRPLQQSQTDDFDTILSRIASRVNYLFSQAPTWKHEICAGGSECSDELIRAIGAILESVENVSKLGWENETSDSKKQMREALLQLMEAETKLNNALGKTDTDYIHNQVMIDQIKSNSGNVKSLLECFATAKTSSAAEGTVKEAVNSVLEECYYGEDYIESMSSSTDNSLKSDRFLNLTTRTINDDFSWDVTNDDEVSLFIDRNKLVFNEDVERLIGKGGFAKVYTGFYDDNDVAVKVFESDLEYYPGKKMIEKERQYEIDRVIREAKLMKKCSIHPNVVEFMGCYIPTDHKIRPFIVMELVDCDLYRMLHKNKYKTIQELSYANCLELMTGIARAIEFLHVQGIVHQDVKTSNILVSGSQMVAKLTDFGETQVKGFKTTRYHYINTTYKRTGKQLAGTLLYQAPEILCREVTNVSRVSEIYSFGVCLWECITRKMPHSGKAAADIYSLAYSRETSMLSCSPEVLDVDVTVVPLEEKKAFDLLLKTASLCLSRDRSRRPTASKAILMLSGQFHETAVVENIILPISIEKKQCFCCNRRRVFVIGATAFVAILFAVIMISLFSSEPDPTYPSTSYPTNPGRETPSPTNFVDSFNPLASTPPDLTVSATLTPSFFPSEELPALKKEWFKFGNDISGYFSNDKAGASVAISRNGLSLAVGAPGQVSDGSSHVYIYKYLQNNWESLVINSTAPYDSTGQSVAFDDSGRVVAVGSPRNGSSDKSGTVRIYEIDVSVYYISGEYKQKGSDITGSGPDDMFGWSVDISKDGNVVVVASLKECYVQAFQYSNQTNDWLKYGQAIGCHGNYSDSWYPTPLSVRLSSDGSVIVIGEPTLSPLGLGPDEDCLCKGYVDVYQFQNASWVRLGQAIEGEAAQDLFGSAVAISNDGEVIAGCAPFNDVGEIGVPAGYAVQDPSIGSCRVYRYSNTNQSWQQMGSDINGSYISDKFGSDVSLDDKGTAIAIGAPGSGDNSGYVRVLQYDENEGSWKKVGQDIVAEYVQAEFGTSVALSANGDTVAVGAPNIFIPNVTGSTILYEVGVTLDNGEIPITVAVYTDLYPEDITWSLERLDVERNQTFESIVVYGATYTKENQTVNTTVKVPNGGVYRFLLRYGETDNCSLITEKHFIDIDNGRQTIKWLNDNRYYCDYYQCTFYVGQANHTSLNDEMPSGSSFLTLEIVFDDHPYDIHWVMVKKERVLDNDSNVNTTIGVNRTVLAFGPETEYSENYQSIETIDVSSVGRGSELLFILTDDGRDGLCCNYGSGHIRLYNGTRARNEIIFESSAQEMMTKRFVKSFYLYH